MTATGERTGTSGPLAKTSTSGAPALEIQSLDVLFGQDPGLFGISFSVAKGERLALVGASGAGKTSLLLAVAGSGPVSAGRVLVEGKDVTSLPPEGRGAVLLAQRPLLFPHLSVFENVAFPLRVRGVARVEILHRVEGALALVRMDGFGARRPQSLSGGQAHRVALARAVVARPQVLLLDEPLTSLDPSLREEVRRSILAVHEEYEPALVLVTHDLTEAGRMADRVGVLLDGSLRQVAPPDQFFRQPASAEVARFLGLANELKGRVAADGSLFLVGWIVKGDVGGAASVSQGPREGPVSLVFGVDAGRVVPLGSGGVPAHTDEVHHYPGGATARVALEGNERGSWPDSSGPLFCEVSVDPNCPPSRGERVEVLFQLDRMHAFQDVPKENR